MQEIEIRQAAVTDLDSLYQLSTFWITAKQIKQSFSLQQLTELICNSEVAVAVDREKVISYYLINPFFETGNVQQRSAIISELVADHTLPQGRYAYSLQSATDPDYLGRGLNTRVLNLLKELAQDKYDYFVGVMGYENIATQKSSLKMGWKHYGDIGIGLLAIVGTTEENHSKLNSNNNAL